MMNRDTALTSQSIREHANRKYAAYSRKSTLAMYRSIQNMGSNAQSQQRAKRQHNLNSGEEEITPHGSKQARNFNVHKSSLPDMKLRGSFASPALEDRKTSQILAGDLDPLTPILAWADSGPIKILQAATDYQMAFGPRPKVGESLP